MEQWKLKCYYREIDLLAGKRIWMKVDKPLHQIKQADKSANYITDSLVFSYHPYQFQFLLKFFPIHIHWYPLISIHIHYIRLVSDFSVSCQTSFAFLCLLDLLHRHLSKFVYAKSLFKTSGGGHHGLSSTPTSRKRDRQWMHQRQFRNRGKPTWICWNARTGPRISRRLSWPRGCCSYLMDCVVESLNYSHGCSLAERSCATHNERSKWDIARGNGWGSTNKVSKSKKRIQDSSVDF